MGDNTRHQTIFTRPGEAGPYGVLTKQETYQLSSIKYSSRTHTCVTSLLVHPLLFPRSCLSARYYGWCGPACRLY